MAAPMKLPLPPAEDLVVRLLEDMVDQEDWEKPGKNASPPAPRYPNAFTMRTAWRPGP